MPSTCKFSVIAINIIIIIISPCGRDLLKIMMLPLEPLFGEDKPSLPVTMLSVQSQVPAHGSSGDVAEGQGRKTDPLPLSSSAGFCLQNSSRRGGFSQNGLFIYSFIHSALFFFPEHLLCARHYA